MNPVRPGQAGHLTRKRHEMPAYNFQKRFAPLVESGRKHQTIRLTAKGARRGATAYLYTGQRTKQCRKLGEGTITDVLPIEIGRSAHGEPYVTVTKADDWRTHFMYDALDTLARNDGFSDGEEMVQWIEGRYGLPFAGYLHQWELLGGPGA